MILIRQLPSCFGTKPSPEVWKFGRGGVCKGPKCVQFHTSFGMLHLCIILGCWLQRVHKVFATYVRKLRSSIASTASCCRLRMRVWSGCKLNSCSSRSDHIGDHYCGLVGMLSAQAAVRWIIGSTDLAAIYKLAVWVTVRVVEIYSTCWSWTSWACVLHKSWIFYFFLGYIVLHQHSIVS